MRVTNPLRALLEVERKFSPSKQSISLIRQNAGHPHFKQVQYLGAQKIEDVYYDQEDLLSRKGIWVRQRLTKAASPHGPNHPSFQEIIEAQRHSSVNETPEWQAKIRRSGNFTNSAFAEIKGSDKVLQTLRDRIPQLKRIESLNNLPVLARISSMRETWKVNDRFTVALDTTDFDHVVGEVELEVDDPWADGNSAAETSRMQKMDADIEDFMEHHKWAFPVNDEVVGKLSAYLKWAEGKNSG